MPKGVKSKKAAAIRESIPEIVSVVDLVPVVELVPEVAPVPEVTPVPEVAPVPEVTPVPVKVKKVPAAKRVPKNKLISVVATVSANGDIQGSFSPEPRRPLIAHLPFRTSEVQFQDGPLIYDPRPPVVPQPYDAMEDDLFQSGAEHLAAFDDDAKTSVSLKDNGSDIATVTAVKDIAAEPAPIKAFKTLDMMIEYKVRRYLNLLALRAFGVLEPLKGGQLSYRQRKSTAFTLSMVISVQYLAHYLIYLLSQLTRR
jgi:hypothetical protein